MHQPILVKARKGDHTPPRTLFGDVSAATYRQFRDIDKGPENMLATPDLTAAGNDALEWLYATIIGRRLGC